MTEDIPEHSPSSPKALFLSGALWESVAQRRSSDPDTRLEDLYVSLHNAQEIDFLSGIDQSAFKALARHQRWRVDTFLGRITPRLDATWTDMADFVDRALPSLGSANTYEIYQPFVDWCAAHPVEALKGVEAADIAGAVPTGHLERALAGLADADLARRLAGTYTDGRRTAALRALSRLDHPTADARLASLNLCRALAEDSPDDELMSAAALLILDGVTRSEPVLDADALAVLGRVLTRGGLFTLGQAGFALTTAKQSILTPELVSLLLTQLARTPPDQAGLMEQLGHGLGRLARWGRTEEAFGFVQSLVTGKEGAPPLEAFEDVFAPVLMGPHDAVHALALAWLYEGRPVLCLGLVDLFQKYDRASSPLTIDFSAFDYTDKQIWFICRRAIGYFLIHEVVAASVVVSALRTAPPDLAEA